MPATAGFEVVAQVTEGVLSEIAQSAWKNGMISHSLPIPPGPGPGPVSVSDGTVNIPEPGPSATTDVDRDAVRLTTDAQVQVEIDNPVVPSLSLFDMSMEVGLSAPLATLPDTINVALIFSEIARDGVTVTMTSGHPLDPITEDLIAEFVHARYADGTIPHDVTVEDVHFGGFTADAFLQLFDDASDSDRRIEVARPNPTQVTVSIPVRLRLSDVSAAVGPDPASPMAVTARLQLTADLSTGTELRADLSDAGLAVTDLGAADGPEGTKYEQNKDHAPSHIDLDELLTSQLETHGSAALSALPDVVVPRPTVAQLEEFVGDQIHAELVNWEPMGVWTPETPEGSSVEVGDVTPRVLAGAVAIAINGGDSGNPDGLVPFIPSDRDFAIGVAERVVQQAVRDAMRRPKDEGGLGGEPPVDLEDVEGHDARLNSLSVDLVDDAIRLEGEVTVVDAIAGSIDVDADFTADVKLRWRDTDAGGQELEPFLPSDPDVDLSLAAWILSFLIGFITLGLVGGLVVLIVMAVVEGVAQSVGSAVIRDEVTGQLQGIGAWPQQLEGIGTVDARFANPVGIDADGLLFAGTMTVTAKQALTVEAQANSGGPYVVDGGSPLELVGGPSAPDTRYQWDFGDGATGEGAVVTHTYADDGVYVAKLTTIVEQPGGKTTRHFARVRVRNVAPTVDAGPDLEVDEGQEIELLATFTDPEWPDVHNVLVNFGDDTLLAVANVSQTNDPPRAAGTARVRHAWCDDGDYTVTVQVADDDGGVGTDTRTVRVRNVIPDVDAGDDLFAYPCTPLRLVARFTDPGWCDTHTAVWDPGDCTSAIPAEVIERREPPAGVGVARALHRYDRCGTYQATCEVRDDDDAEPGRDTVVVRVVDVVNGDFESGFRHRAVGGVANAWHPWVAGAVHTRAPQPDAEGLFAPEARLVHSGQRSQRIAGSGPFLAGMNQQVGANPGWDYQVTAYYHLDERAGGRVRLGVDATGGRDPGDSAVVWSEGTEQRQWARLAVRATAEARAITIHLMVEGDDRGARGYLDDVALVPYPCPEPVEPERPPTKPESRCVDWREESPGTQLAEPLARRGFAVSSPGRQGLQTVGWGLPDRATALLLPHDGLMVRPPWPAARVTASVAQYTSQPVRLRARDADDVDVGVDVGTAAQGDVQLLTVTAPRIAAIMLDGGGGEAVVAEVCAEKDQPDDLPAVSTEERSPNG